MLLHNHFSVILLSSVLPVLTSAQALYRLNWADSTILVGAEQACLDAFNGNVSCPQAIGSLYGNLYTSFDDSVLSLLCSTTCYNSLVDHRQAVASSCAGIPYVDPNDGSSWPATYKSDQALFNYNYTCLKRR